MRGLLAVLLSIVCLGGSLAHAQQGVAAASQDLRGFWKRDDAKAWEKPVSPNSSQVVVYRDYPQMIDQLNENAQAAAARQAAESRIPAIPQNLQNTPENQTIPGDAAREPQRAAGATQMTRDQILAKYGAPEEAQIIRAQKDAPPAMQGLFEALNSNDKELAFRYAVALARRQAEMQKVVSKATDYQIIAMEALGVRPPPPMPDDGEPIDPIRAELQEYYEQARQAELKNGSAIDLHLAESQQQDSQLAPEAAAAAAQARTAQLQNIPKDPEGKVKMLIFIDEKATDAPQAVASLRAVRTQYQSDPRFSALGLTKRTYSLSALKKRSAELSFPFPLVSGEALAIDLRIRSYPTTVFVAVTTKETYRIEGLPGLDEVQKIVAKMREQGK